MDILQLALEQSRTARLNGTAKPVRPRSAAHITFFTKNEMIAVPFKFDERNAELRCREFMKDVDRIAAEAQNARTTNR
jgi:hypothetical protein